MKYDYIYETTENTTENLTRVKIDGKYGFIDIKGNVAIPCIFNRAWRFSEGLAGVSIDNGKHGFINKKGDIVIPCEYNDVDDFREGFAPVKIDGKWGFINKQGQIVVCPKYYSVSGFENGFCSAHRRNFYKYQDEETIYLDIKGNEFTKEELAKIH